MSAVTIGRKNVGNDCPKPLTALASLLLGCAASVVLNPLSAKAQTYSFNDVQVKTYTVTGKTGAEIRNSLNQNRPKGYDGYTEWYVRWSWSNPRGQGNECRFQTYQTSLAVTMTLPQWQASPGASPELARAWSQYLVNLRTHEDGHVENGKGAAKDIAAQLADIVRSTPCSDVQDTTKTLLGRIIRRYNQQDIDYDAKTNHGKTQGARFP